MYTILVVDDSPMIVDVFVTMLTRKDYKTVRAYSGKECMQILQKTKPDLILLDIMMEPMDGWETLEKIKNNPETADIPVVMLTAKPLTGEEAAEYGAYMEDYILKPTTHEHLYDTIEHVLERRDAIRNDTERARKAGFDEKFIEEYETLCRSADVDKRLLKIIEASYGNQIPRSYSKEKISSTISDINESIRQQEERLQHLRDQLTKPKEKTETA